MESFEEWVPLGKFLIAQNMKGRERVDRLFPPANSGWYQYLFNRMLDSDGGPEFSENMLGIITFNYDRSLEAYLHEALQARFGISGPEAASRLAGLSIVHVHGLLGPYPDVPYQRDYDLDQLVAISESIQVIHEIPDDADGFCNTQFERAHAMLEGAARIFFLGFGFHEDNIRRFKFFSPYSTDGVVIGGTMTGMGNVELKELLERLKEQWGISMTPTGHDCSNFFTHSQSL